MKNCAVIFFIVGALFMMALDVNMVTTQPSTFHLETDHAVIGSIAYGGVLAKWVLRFCYFIFILAAAFLSFEEN